MEAKLIGIADAGKMLGVSTATLYRLIDDDKLKAVKIGKRRLVSLESLNTVINGGAK